MATTTKKTITKKVSTSYSSTSQTSYSVKKTSASSLGSAPASSSVSIQSSSQSYVNTGEKDIGMDAFAQQVRSNMQNEMDQLKTEAYCLIPLAKPGSNNQIVKLSDVNMIDFLDKSRSDRFKFNFDIQDYSAETINVKAIGNKIEVHALKKTITDGEEVSEEFNTTYELPSAVDPNKVSSQMFKNGVLTVELPKDALVKAN